MKDKRPIISGMKVRDPLLEEPKDPKQRFAMWVGGGIAAIGVHIVAGFTLVTLAPLLQTEHDDSKSDAIEMEVVDKFEEFPEPEPEVEPEPEPEPEVEPEPEPEPEVVVEKEAEVVKPDAKPDPAEAPPEDAPPNAKEAMDPVNLEGLTLESTSDSGDMAIKVGTGIQTGKITNKYVDPKRFGKIKTAEGGQGEGYGESAPATAVAPKNCPFVKPEGIRKVKGVYPAEARRRQIEGNVVALVSISAEGRVTDVKIVTSVGYGLDESASDAFKQWTFKPAQKDCKAVDYKLRLTHTFSMEDN